MSAFAGPDTATDLRRQFVREDQLRLGLWMFLGSVTMLFAAFTSALVVRRSGTDWRPAIVPAMLWINTLVLGTSSVVLELATGQGRRRRWRTAAVAAAGALALGIAFVIGQFVAWKALAAQGVYLSTNPSSSFFFMITGAHAVHVVAALIVLAWGAGITWSGYRNPRAWAARFELCRTFWHYLGIVWLFLFLLIRSV